MTDADIKALYVKQHGTDKGWCGIEGSYFISGVQAALAAQDGQAVDSRLASLVQQARMIFAKSPDMSGNILAREFVERADKVVDPDLGHILGAAQPQGRDGLREALSDAVEAMRDAAYDEEGYTMDPDLAEAHDRARAALATQKADVGAPFTAIGTLVKWAIEAAVASGATSVSMPDEIVTVAAWLNNVAPPASAPTQEQKS